MRMSQVVAPTLREDPSEAEVVSHKLMLRGGFIKKLAAGVLHLFTAWLPHFTQCYPDRSGKRWTAPVPRKS